jgi:hypothetical protein
MQSSNAFQRFTNYKLENCMKQLWLILLSIFRHFFTAVLIHCSVCLHVSITHHSLVLMSLRDEDI